MEKVEKNAEWERAVFDQMRRDASKIHDFQSFKDWHNRFRNVFGKPERVIQLRFSDDHHTMYVDVAQMRMHQTHLHNVVYYKRDKPFGTGRK